MIPQRIITFYEIFTPPFLLVFYLFCFYINLRLHHQHLGKSHLYGHLVNKIIHMKKIIFFLSLCLCTVAFSQAPEGINYQAVMRTSSGSLVTNSTVAIRVQIRQGSASGTTVYQERQGITSSSQGLINMVIGAGTPQVGTFNNINWAVGPFFVNLGVDFSNGVNYQDFGTQQLMSVPPKLRWICNPAAHKST